MPVECNDFLKMAKSSLEHDDDESGYRNSVSRSYYCMYHLASSLINKRNIPRYDGKKSKYVKGGVHAKMIHYLTVDACNHEPYEASKLRKIGLMLKVNKRLRTVADYELDKTVTKLQAQDVMLQAAEMEELVSGIRQKHSSGAA